MLVAAVILVVAVLLLLWVVASSRRWGDTMNKAMKAGIEHSRQQTEGVETCLREFVWSTLGGTVTTLSPLTGPK